MGFTFLAFEGLAKETFLLLFEKLTMWWARIPVNPILAIIRVCFVRVSLTTL